MKDRLEEIKERLKRATSGLYGKSDIDFANNAPSDIEWLIEEVERLERMLNFVKEDRVLRGQKMYDFMMGENNKKEVKKT